MNYFIKKTQVGIDLGSSSIKIAGLGKKGKNFNLEFYQIVDLTEEYALDSFMKVTDDHYVEQLQKLDSKYNLKNARLSFLLPTNLAIIQVLSIKPSLTESELLDKIRHALRQATSEDLDEMQIVCHELQDDAEDGQVPILVCAIPSDVIARYKRIISAAGLKANVFDLDALGLYNAFYYFSEMNFGPTTLVQVDDRVSICVIIVPGKSPFFNVINLGAAQLANGKPNPETLQQEDSKWTDLKFFQNLSGKKSAPSAFDNLASEVKKCIRHTQAHEGILDFERIYLTGGGRVLPELADTFQKSLKIETKIWNPVLQFANGSKQTAKNDGVYLASAIGTALRGD